MDCNFGRLFIAGFEGTKLTKDLEEKLKKLNPAGIILYDTNIESKQQVQDLISALKKLLGDNLIITVDQEGGKVERLRKICTSLPSLQALGRASIKNPQFLIDHSSVLAEELTELGFNLALGPCADLSTNPLNPIIGTRSLGADTELVSEQLKVILETYRKHGLKSCIKHFPGHGDTSVDSHLDLPIQNHAEEEYAYHLKPFITAINSGADSVMIAHLLTLKDLKLPASISSKVIQEELRKNLGFKGLVISDEITMKALNQFGDYSKLAEKIIVAGTNLVCWNSNLDDALQAARYLNEQTREDNKLLYDAYYRSVELLNSYDWQLKSNTPINDKESKMLKIVEAAIEYSKPINEIREIFEEGPTAVLIYDHPKLELDIIKNVFKLDCYKFTGKESSIEFLNKYTNLLILSFQTINNVDEDNFIICLRNSAQWNIVQCSCDMPDRDAEIHLFGGNKVHLQAIIRILA